jgi:hypothetical protein
LDFSAGDCREQRVRLEIDDGYIFDPWKKKERLSWGRRDAMNGDGGMGLDGMLEGTVPGD